MSITDLAHENLEAFNKSDWRRLRETLKSNCIYDEYGTHRHFEGADKMINVYQEWKEAIPDAKGVVRRTTTADNTVTLELTWEGKQSGKLQTPQGVVPPTNRSINVHAAEIIEVDNNKITKINHYFDMGEMLEQIGANATR